MTTKLLIDRFLSWPLPESLCSDPCASMPGYPHRTGTNLMTAEQAKAMLDYVLATPAPVQAEPASLCDARVMDVLLMWNRRHEEPPIKVGYEYGVAQTVMQIMRGQPLPPAPVTSHE